MCSHDEIYVSIGGMVTTTINVLNAHNWSEFEAECQGTSSLWAIDLETDAWSAFRPRVCLIQLRFSPTGPIWLLDPCLPDDGGMFEQGLGCLTKYGAHKKWLFHDAVNDLRFLTYDLNLPIQDLADTALAARILKYEKTGLGALVQSVLNIHIDKAGHQADWRGRPLPEDLLTYAAEDVLYLHQLWEKCAQDLKNAALEHVFMDEAMALILESVPYRMDEPEDIASRDGSEIKKIDSYPVEVQRCIRCLCQARAYLAAEHNVHVGKILANYHLISTAEYYAQHRQIRFKQRTRLKEDHQLAQKLEAALDSDWPGLQYCPPSREHRAKIKSLKSMRKQLAENPAHQHYPWILTSKQLEAIAQLTPEDIEPLLKKQDLSALKASTKLRDWQVDAFGAEVLVWLSTH